ncbi:MAG: IdeS/Mac family cysteine endopeptidase [Alistipes sp.]|nr:IdeS/Mac family cysteine endopeptidase [Alistipes sp.]
MTKYLHFLGAALMLLIASCSTDIDVINPEFDPALVEISVVAESNDQTRLMLDGNRTEWEVGDRITLALTGSTTMHYTFEIASAEDISNEGKTARFTGRVAMGSYTQCTAIYPAIGDNTTLSRHDEAVYMAARHEEAFEISSQSASIPLSFSHLMHKLDYNLTLDAGYTDTDISKGVAIEMVARSSGEEFSLEQCRSFNIYTAYSDTAAASTSHIADFTQHNFAMESIASVLIFPTTIPSAELEFNVYVEGRKAHTIVKSLNRDFTMSAGKSSKISLKLNADNKCEEEVIEDNGGGGIVSDFEPDYYITTFKSGVSGISASYGVGYRAYFNNTFFDVHIPIKYASSSSINEGDYTWTGTSWFGYNSFQDFTTRNAGSLGLASSASLESGSKMVVSKSGDTYIINITLVDKNSKTVKVQYIGELNVDNGGQTGGNSGGNGGSTSSAQPDITLSSLSLESGTNYHSLVGSNSSGDAITLNVNAIDGIASGVYEHIALGYCQHKGYFNASDIKVSGTAKSAKSGILYIAKDGSATTLHADITFTDGTTRHFKFEGNIDLPVVEGDIELSASKSSIVGNGIDSVKFTVMQDGKEVTNECSIYINDSWYSSSFSSTTPGTYTVYATKGAKRSNTVTITVTEYKPSSLTLSASKTSIKANGTDSVTFTVKADGTTTVTNLCDIFIDGAELNGTTFTTYNAGSYSVYAKYNGVTSNTVTLTATAVESGTMIVFAEGVTQSSGWYDVNKMAAGANGDTMMCWAAAASNMIQWWQDGYVAAGNKLPSGAVTGAGTKMHSGTGFSRCYELALMDVFHSQWTNLERGSQSDYAISWYFEGKLNGGEYASNQAKPTTSGGYFSSIWSSSIYPELYHDYEDGAVPWLCYDLYTTCYNNYNLWGSKSGNECWSEFSNYIVEFMGRGIAALTIQPGSSALHAVTLWGYEIDKSSGLVTRLWLTDSDDQTNEPKTCVLNEYNVSVSGSKIKLNGSTRYGECTVIDIIPFSGYGSAE